MPAVDLLPLLSAAATSAIGCWMLIRASHQTQLGIDHTAGEPQKKHQHPTPRVGGFAVLAGGVIGMLAAVHRSALITGLLLALLPLMATGIWEDLRRHLPPKLRAAVGLISAALVVWLCQASVRRLGVPVADAALQAAPALGVVLAVIAIGSMPHAFNMIDGFHGLASGFTMMVLGSIAWVAHRVGDVAILTPALVLMAAVAGFMVWNWPAGRIFLGDAGAYLLGFVSAALAVMLVDRNPTVSPWFALLLLLYPSWELIFSLLRRKLVHARPGMHPDSDHLHHLVHKALGCVLQRTPLAACRGALNAATAPVMWLLALVAIGPALLSWSHATNPAALISATLIYIVLYSTLHLLLQRANASCHDA